MTLVIQGLIQLNTFKSILNFVILQLSYLHQGIKNILLKLFLTLRLDSKRKSQSKNEKTLEEENFYYPSQNINIHENKVNPLDYFNGLIQSKKKENLKKIIEDLNFENKVISEKLRDLENKVAFQETRKNFSEFDKGNLVESFKNLLAKVRNENYDSENSINQETYFNKPNIHNFSKNESEILKIN